MSVSQILTEFGIPAATTKRISNDLFPLVGGTAGSTCFLGASFSGKSANYPVGYSTFGSTCTGRGIAVDSSKNIYITGNYSSATTVPIRTFGAAPTASGVSLPATAGGIDAFVIKWNANGTVAGYSTISGNGNDVGYGIAVDSSQNIYVAGQYVSTLIVPINTFGTAPAASGVNLPASLGTDGFVIKWNGSGGTVAGYSNIRGNSVDIGYGIVVDSSQNIYITGTYNSTVTVPIRAFGTAPALSGVSMPVTTVGDAFVIKWNAAGTLAGYSNIKGNGADQGNAIAVDSSQNIYITGYYTSGTTVQLNTFGTAPAPSGVIMPATAGGTDAFVVKWNAAGGAVAGYATIRGNGNDIGYGIAVDSSRNIYITGQYVSSAAVAITNFSTTPFASGVNLPASLGVGFSDVFVIKWTGSTGAVAGYSTIRGTDNDIGYGIAVDSSQNIYIAGQYTSSATVPINTFGTAPSASGVSMPASSGAGGDAFVIKWNAAGGTLAGYSRINGNGTDIGYGVAFDSSSNISVTGNYSSTVIVPINTFGTAPVASGVSMPVSVNDAFVIKWNA